MAPGVLLLAPSIYLLSHASNKNLQAPVVQILVSPFHLTSHRRTLLSLNRTKMANHLQLASRIEAAMAAYTSVCDFCDRKPWMEKFREEFVSIHLPVHHLHTVRALSTFEIENCH